MAQSKTDDLNAGAFRLSKILRGFNVKLSSQQCLDVVSRYEENVPYEVVAAHRADESSRDSAARTASEYLHLTPRPSSNNNLVPTAPDQIGASTLLVDNEADWEIDDAKFMAEIRQAEERQKEY